MEIGRIFEKLLKNKEIQEEYKGIITKMIKYKEKSFYEVKEESEKKKYKIFI